MENTKGTAAKRPGRPRKHSAEIKRHNVTVVMTEPMREAIRSAAEIAGRSVSSEIDYRLGMSLALDRDTGSAAVRRLIDFTRLAATKLQEEAGKEWTEDEELAARLIGAIMGYIRGNSPPSPEMDEEWDLEMEASTIRAQLATLEKWREGGHRHSEDEFYNVLDRVLDYSIQFKNLELRRREKRMDGMEATHDLASLFKINSGS